MIPDPAGAPAAETVLANARVVLPDRVITGAVQIRGEEIADISEGAHVPHGAEDCAGDVLAPGLIELHTDNLERHMQPRPGVTWPQTAAIVAHDAELASVGITTVFDALRVGSITSKRRSRYGKYARDLSREIIRLRARGALRISHFIHLRAEICSETLIEELAEFSPDDRIGIVSLMDHTPGERQFADTTQLRVYLKGKYAMADHEIDAHIDHQKAVKAKFGALHETGAVSEANRLGAIIASHDDTTEAHVEASVKSGARVAEFPTTLEAAAATHRNGIGVMMGAPNLLRGGSHSGNVAAGTLAEAGLLDILSSDYAPFSLLAAAVKLGEIEGNLARGIARVTDAPARAAQLDDRGRIEPGLRADLVRFRVEGETPVTRALWVRGHRVG